MAFINLPAITSPSYKDSVATASALPTLNNIDGDVRVVLDTSTIYVWSASGDNWVASGGGGGGITSLNAQSGAAQTFAAGSSGNDFAISSALNVHTFNIPSASSTARGLVTTGAQSFAGNKTFDNDVAISGNYAEAYRVEKFTLNAGDITAKSITLARTPVSASKTILIVIGGAEQDYGVDYTVSGAILDWDGLALDGILESGDKIIVLYS